MKSPFGHERMPRHERPAWFLNGVFLPGMLNGLGLLCCKEQEAYFGSHGACGSGRWARLAWTPSAMRRPAAARPHACTRSPRRGCSSVQLPRLRCMRRQPASQVGAPCPAPAANTSPDRDAAYEERGCVAAGVHPAPFKPYLLASIAHILGVQGCVRALLAYTLLHSSRTCWHRLPVFWGCRGASGRGPARRAAAGGRGAGSGGAGPHGRAAGRLRLALHGWRARVRLPGPRHALRLALRRQAITLTGPIRVRAGPAWLSGRAVHLDCGTYSVSKGRAGSCCTALNTLMASIGRLQRSRSMWNGTAWVDASTWERGAEMHDTPFEVVRAVDSGCAVALTESAGGTACVRAVRLADMKEVNIIPLLTMTLPCVSKASALAYPNVSSARSITGWC